MGFRYRKSINLGGGFRINLSKSGIGYSWGVKGYRVTKTAKGTTRTTASIPGTGISYVHETGKANNRSSQRNTNPGQQPVPAIHRAQLTGKVVNIFKQIFVNCLQGREFTCWQGIKHAVFKQFYRLFLADAFFFPGKIGGACQPQFVFNAHPTATSTLLPLKATPYL